MAVEIPKNLNREAFLEVYTYSGAKFEHLVEALSKSEEDFAKEVMDLHSPSCEEVLSRIKETSSNDEVFLIRKSERNMPRAPAVKRLVTKAILRQMYQIALKATAS